MAITIQWDPKYSIHDATIDAEHQELFALVNDVMAIEVPQLEPVRFRADVKKLFRYMEYHFQHEEELMKEVGYPDREAHAEKHRKIVALMNGMIHNCVSLPELAERIRHVLVVWLLRHVAEEDQRIAQNINPPVIAEQAGTEAATRELQSR
jgi:hemerythrin